jgi:hypothetical protein
MLGDEHGVTAVRSLLAVVARLGRGEPPGDQVPGVQPHRGRPAQLGGDPVAATQMEPRAERLLRDGVQLVVG